MADYHVFKIGDVSFAGAVRWDVKVTVEPEATRDELLDIARSIAADFRESRPYHALSAQWALRMRRSTSSGGPTRWVTGTTPHMGDGARRATLPPTTRTSLRRTTCATRIGGVGPRSRRPTCGRGSGIDTPNLKRS
jgi:hypothetical protein